MSVETLTNNHINTHSLHSENHHSHGHSGLDTKAIFGFWIYIMSDCILFACLFATYAVLYTNTYGGPGGVDLFSLSFVLTETIILLTSSFTYGLVILAMHKQSKSQALLWLLITFLLGATFVGMELWEFSELVHNGHSWQNSAFLSAFFTLVGTHGLHVSIGLLWMFFLIIQVIRTGFSPLNMRKLVTLSLFWHFLDIVWIFVFSIVYLLGMA